MNHLDIRNTFIKFFENHGHTLVAPSNIIPQDDPTLLFTNAGMNQFKDVLLGKEKRSYTRAISVQPCMRVGGKHNDLDEVGRDGRHLTWFEMLGNWSFGDYGKEEAIRFAWDLVTKHLPLDISKIYISVYKTDDESYNIWRGLGVPENRLVRLGNIEEGDEENFWSMGPTGPCGRCTELYYDQGEELFGHDVVGGATDRFLEFWNVVFMEFNRDETGAFNPLAQLGVDTGMGMERMAALLEGKSNVFETSLFQPIIDHISKISNHPQTGESLVAMRVLADHSRGLTFALRDHGQFDKAGRGYVLRRILRRAVLHGTKLGFQEPFLYKLVAENLKNLPVYPVTPTEQKRIETEIKREEERFFETLDRGLQFFEKASQNKQISGAAAFQLHDTFGFPIDLTQILCEERGVTVDLQGFETALEEQRQRSQSAAQFHDKGGWVEVQAGNSLVQPTHHLSMLDTKILQYRLNAEDESVELILEQSPFYVEGGGELADHGTLSAENLVLEVKNVQKTPLGIIHTAILPQKDVETFKKCKTLKAAVNLARRAEKAKHHTATHLLHAALRKALGESVKQMGSMVDNVRLRFDISFPRALTAPELEQVETLVNTWVLENHPVQHHIDVAMENALQMGALAFFGDKYGEKVRVIQIPEVSVELCGGNHVERTGDIGSIALLSDEALGSGVRRIEAVVGMAAVELFRNTRTMTKALAQQLFCPVPQIPAKIEKLAQDVKDAKAALQKALKASSPKIGVEELVKSAQMLGGKKVILADMQQTPEEQLTGLVDTLRVQQPDALVVLVRIDEDGVGTVLTGAGDVAIQQGGHAGNLAKEIGKKLGSGGGGKPTFARAGFKNADFAAVAAAVQAVLG